MNRNSKKGRENLLKNVQVFRETTRNKAEEVVISSSITQKDDARGREKSSIKLKKKEKANSNQQSSRGLGMRRSGNKNSSMNLIP